jgi:hypothetical protein
MDIDVRTQKGVVRGRMDEGVATFNPENSLQPLSRTGFIAFLPSALLKLR